MHLLPHSVFLKQNSSIKMDVKIINYHRQILFICIGYGISAVFIILPDYLRPYLRNIAVRYQHRSTADQFNAVDRTVTPLL